MPCMFCGQQGALSREHVFTRWIRESFGPVVGDARQVRRVVTETEDDHQEYPATKMLEIVVRRVCRKCNSDWMSRMDDDVRPALEPLLADEPRRLSAVEQDMLALWVTKIVLTLQAANVRRSRVVPDSMYNWFYEHRRPLPGSHVWLFRYTDHEYWPFVAHHWGASFALADSPAPKRGDPLNGFSSVFALGHLGASLFAADLPGGPHTQAGSDDQMRLIWPLNGGEAAWPPPRSVGAQADLAAMARRMPGDARVRGLTV